MDLSEPITPLPMDASSWLLVGGTFDPPHIGHVVLPSRARDTTCPDAALLFVPAARSPHKPAGPNVSDAERLDLVRAAIGDVPNAAVWTDELDRAGAGTPSYWVETLRRLRSIAPDAGLRFVVGADQALALHRWRESAAILRLAQPVVLLRDPVETQHELLAGLEALGTWSASEVGTLAAQAADVGTFAGSSTEARRMLADDPENTRLESLLAPGVLEIIRERGLYRGGL
ncbi:MAG: nicotinate-nicotinamide nucleotide adenylyltransferase [Planctomycetota bacterium]